MLKQFIQFKSVINDIESNFNFELNCPTGVAKEALFACLKWIGQLEDQEKAKQEAVEKEKNPEIIPVELPVTEEANNVEPTI